MYAVTDTIWFWLVMVLYLAMLMIFGYVSRKKTKTITDWMVASRGIGPVLLALSYGATYFSAVLIIGSPGNTWNLGEQWLYITFTNLIFGTFVAFLMLGNRSRRMSQKLGAITLPELIAERYQDKSYIRQTSGLILGVFLTIYLVSVYIGMSVLLTVLFPGFEFAFQIAVILCGVVTVSYLVIGGSHGAILSDVVESMIMLVAVVGLVIGGIAIAGGLAQMNANIAADVATAPGPLHATPELWFLFPNTVSMPMIGMAMVTAFGTWGSPQMSTRFFTAKSRKSIRYGMLIACVWVFVVSFCAWFSGAVARGLSPNSSAELASWVTSIGAPSAKAIEYVIPWALVNYFPIWFAAIFLAGVLAASLTTGEKLIIVASGSITRDFWQKGIMRHKNISDEKTLTWTRIFVVIIIVAAILLTLTRPAFILDLCMWAWSCLNAFTLVPYVSGLYWKGGTKRAAFISGIIALVVSILWFFLFYPKWTAGMGLPLFPGVFTATTYIHEFIISQAVAIPAFFIISYFDKNKPDKAFLEDLYKYVKEDTND